VAARHLQLDTKVAIKFLLPAMLASPEAVSRFAREARAAVKITGEHVARVFDVGTLETGAPYMVMEFLEGGDLAAWVQQRGALAIEMAVDFVLQACVAVTEAHSLGIVHRDIKPANLFCIRRADGQLTIKVLDFGISKVTELGGSGPGMSVTKTSAMMGSPLYMSPEQMQSSKDVDGQTDIWALGVVLYELLAGQVPFNGETLPEVCVKIATQPPPPLHTFRRDVPDGLRDVIAKALEKDRARRYRTVAEFAMALADFAPRRARASLDRIAGMASASGVVMGGLPTPPDAGLAATQAAPETMSPFGHTAHGRTASDGRAGSKRPWLFAAGAAIVTGVVAIAVVVGRPAASHPEGRAPAATSPALSAAERLPEPTASIATPPPPTALAQPQAPEAPAPVVAAALPSATAATPASSAKAPAAHPAPHGHAAAPATPPSPAPTTPAAAAPPPAAPPPPSPPPAPTPTHHAAPNANPLDLQLQ
jgi:eukaryotic-like serine/threonine-protein kinase